MSSNELKLEVKWIYIFYIFALKMLFSPTRGGMDIQVRSLDGSKFKESNILKKHDMIVNTLLADGDLLLSAGWDSRLLIWVKLF